MRTARDNNQFRTNARISSVSACVRALFMPGNKEKINRKSTGHRKMMIYGYVILSRAVPLVPYNNTQRNNKTQKDTVRFFGTKMDFVNSTTAGQLVPNSFL